jgi:hypothetical protein
MHITITFFQFIVCTKNEKKNILKKRKLSVRFFDIKRIRNGNGHVYKEIIYMKTSFNLTNFKFGEN